MSGTLPPVALGLMVPAGLLLARLVRAGMDPGAPPGRLRGAACLLGLALPLGSPSLWRLLGDGRLGWADAAGLACLAALLGLLAMAALLEGARGGTGARLVAGAVLGGALLAGHMLLRQVAALPPPPLAAQALALVLALGAGLGAAWLLRPGLPRAARWAGPALTVLALAAPGLAELPAMPAPGPGGWVALAVAAALGPALMLAGRLALREEREPAALAAMLRATPEAGVLLRHGRTEVANAAFLALLGQPETLVRGRLIQDLFPREGADWHHAAQSDRLPAWGRARLYTNQGLRVVEVAATPIVAGEGRVLLLARDLRDQAESEARLSYLQRHDPLTGLLNRGEVLATLARGVERARLPGASFAVIQIGLDGFRAFNDLHGQAAGDLVLAEAARRLRAEAGEERPAARPGGDEFVVLLEASPGAPAPDALAARLLQRLAEPYGLGSETVVVTACAGIAIFPADAEDAEALLALAGAAMRRAKSEGRGRIAAADPERDAAAREARALEGDLRRALEYGELALWLQPQVDPRTRAPLGFEALMRWRHPVHGLVPPDRFIPVAEAAGLIGDLGAWAIREGARLAAAWPLPMTMAVNVSPLQLARGDLPALVRAALEETGLPPAQFELELTESLLLDPSPAVLGQLHALRAMGVRVALDDFGTGYSSLAALRAFPFDKVKMDRAFLRAFGEDPKAEEVIRAVLALGRALGMKVVAEGVETPAQFAFLAREGCALVQGWLTGRPATGADFPEIIAQGRLDDATLAKLPQQQHEDEGAQQGGREGAAPARRPRRKQAQPRAGEEQVQPEGDGQGPAQGGQVHGAQQHGELDVAAAQQAPAPRRQQRGQPDQPTTGHGQRRGAARQQPGPEDEGKAGKQQGIGDAPVAQVRGGNQPGPKPKRRQPSPHSTPAAAAPAAGAP